jgi:tRNA uridine 5-carboxymethylaminomethyl modification enzyme
MFTSRAEYRILLRQDNADVRLTELSHNIGLASDERMRRVGEKIRYTQELSDFINETSVSPSAVNSMLESLNTPALQQRVRLVNLLLRPEVTMQNLMEVSSELRSQVDNVTVGLREEVLNATEVQLKYKRYIEKEQDVASRILKFEDISLPADFDYYSLQSLSYEAREKLTKLHPATIGQASRISGVSPADISVLLITLNTKDGKEGGS